MTEYIYISRRNQTLNKKTKTKTQNTRGASFLESEINGNSVKVTRIKKIKNNIVNWENIEIRRSPLVTITTNIL